jgi:hypothetical protein
MSAAVLDWNEPRIDFLVTAGTNVGSPATR